MKCDGMNESFRVEIGEVSRSKEISARDRKPSQPEAIIALDSGLLAFKRTRAYVVTAVVTVSLQTNPVWGILLSFVCFSCLFLMKQVIS